MDFKTVLIAGAGTMGRGIAELMALADFEVQLWDRQPGVLGRASAMIEKSLRKQKDCGRISAEHLNETLERIRLISDLKIVSPHTNLVVEAIIEEPGAKKALFAHIENQLPAAWFITHTASLSIAMLAESLKKPERLIGMHFFNPAPVMPLVEIVYCMKTDKVWVKEAAELAERRLGKTTVTVKDSPGFASTRLSTAMALEAMRMVEQNVASAADIDRAMEYGYRHPMGPLRYSDWVGLDLRLQVARVLFEELKSEVFRPPAILEKLVAEGKLGKKTGQGFYSWPQEG